ncbi:MAG: pyrimidine-nucleoside phosphorylase, partial [Chloroflexi bacterium]|nr:pyrimidine-nucleoside phosphorylase [Chloroflexota bacterium]
GRSRKGEAIDPRAGIVLHAKVGDRVERGAPFAEVHLVGRPDDVSAVEMVRSAFRWSARAVPRRRLFLGTLGAT